MNSLDKLREAKTMAEADPILRKLGASGPIRKLVEASILQRMSPNPASYEYGVQMVTEAIQFLDKEEEPASPETPGVKPKNDHFVKEETLDNHNPETGNTGSEQSTENVEPYSGEGKQTGDEDMVNAPDTTNQMSEMAIPPILNEEVGGLHPDIAKQMGAKMPTIPPMNAGDQMKQTRYTMQKYHETVVAPLLKHSKMQDAAIKKLSQQIQETQAKAGTYTLDMDVTRNNTNPANIRETVNQPTTMQELIATRKTFVDLDQTRNEIRTLNNQMSI